MNTVTIFGLTFNISPVAFELPILGGWSVYWYGIIIALGVLSALAYGIKNGNRFGINPDHIFDSFLVVLPCSILSARAYYIIFDPSGSSFSDFFNFKDGQGFSGLAIYGGVIGAVITIFIMQRIKKFNILAALDVTAVGFLIGQGIGRWGNFFNQEAYGTFTGSDWFGMTGNVIAREMGSRDLVHPCFLYESLWCIVGAVVLHYFSKKRKFKGQIALMYGAWYGFERTFIELLRTDSLMLGPFKVSSLLSAVLCITCTVLLIILFKRTKEKEQSYEPVFSDVDEITKTGENEVIQDNIPYEKEREN
ncbi:MAG: prolipoprotein diacylglyceryl transferase [Clostridia bacterium]|nr:prolipoprotein diacylglyceryl transferase [Clostridia bacterium]